MRRINNPERIKWKALSERPTINLENLNQTVNQVFDEIQKEGDKAVKKYTHFFDRVDMENFEVPIESINNSCKEISKELKNAIQLAFNNILKFHKTQVETVQITETIAGVKCWRENRAIEKVGIYIPGGSAPLFSTILMLGIPAKIAGCPEIILCTPPRKDGSVDPVILYTAKLVGINRIYAVGGIQAIGGLTFGTETIPNVDKIVGPGNQYVTVAKQVAQNFGVSIDMPAGPSELLIIADKSANPAFVASDLLSQAEHGIDSQVVMLSTDKTIIESVLNEIDNQLAQLERKEIAEKALENCNIILLNSITECIDFSNQYAPEHLILAVENYQQYISQIVNAGSVFLGNLSCESAGDYASGTNHTLPTNGYAKSYSGVSIDTFLKKITFQELTVEGIKNIGPAIEIMAETEKLMGHKNAVSIRLKELAQ